VKIIILFFFTYHLQLYSNSTESVRTLVEDSLKKNKSYNFKELGEELGEKNEDKVEAKRKQSKGKDKVKLKARKKGLLKTSGSRSSFVTNNLTGLIVKPQKGSIHNELDVFEGDTVEIEILENMIGYGDSVRSVRGQVISGPLRGYIVLGNVSMDKKTKELLVDFNKIRSRTGKKRHKFKAEMRLKGRHETNFWNYFWASVGANAIGGFAEGSKDREHTIVGSKAVVSPENMVKNSVARAGSAGANIFAEELKNYPEFTVVIGPVIENAIISEEPDSIN
jgi:hypothetical protein